MPKKRSSQDKKQSDQTELSKLKKGATARLNPSQEPVGFNPFELFFQHIPHACFLVTDDGRIRAANQLASLWVKTRPEEALGLPVETVLGSPLPTPLSELWKENKPLNWDIRIGPKTVLCSLHPLPEAAFSPHRLAALFLADITENLIREEKIRRQLDQQRFLLQLASSLLVCPIENMEKQIEESLPTIGRYAQADRAAVIFERSSGQQAVMVAEWHLESRPSLKPQLQNISCSIFPCWYEILKKAEIVRVSKLSDLPAEAKAEKKFLEAYGIKSLLMIPIFQEQRLIGLLGVSSQEEKEWPEETINFLALTAEVLVSAFKRRQRGQTIATLLHIGEAAAVAESLELLLQLIHRSISQLLPVRNFYLALYNEEKKEVSFPYFIDEKDPKPQPRSLRRGLTEYVLRTGQPLLANSQDIEKLAAAGEIEIIGTIPVVWLGVPLKINGRTIGVMALQSYDETVTYTQEDEALLRLISEDVALAINRKKNEAELAEKEQFLRNIFMSLQDGLCVLDRDYNIISVNQVMEQWYGASRPLVGKKCYQAYHGRSEPCYPCPTRRTLETGLPAMEVVPFRPAEGQTKGWLEVFAFPLIDKKTNQTTGVIEHVRDITARKEAEERLQESLREKDTLLRELHHRVKNNMQVISSLLNLQANHVADPAAKEMFRESQRRIRSMALVHEQLYQSANLSQINFANYLRHLSSHLFQSCGVSTHRVHLHLELEELFLEVNTAIPLGMIFNELLTNSLKHAFPGERSGEVRIGFRRFDEQKACLEIRDNGIGLPADFSFDNTETLGLQIVHTLSNQIKAKIELDTAAGTSFKIFFPISSEP